MVLVFNEFFLVYVQFFLVYGFQRVWQICWLLDETMQVNKWKVNGLFPQVTRLRGDSRFKRFRVILVWRNIEWFDLLKIERLDMTFFLGSCLISKIVHDKYTSPFALNYFIKKYFFLKKLRFFFIYLFYFLKVIRI